MTPQRVVQRRRTGLIAALAAVLFLLGLFGAEQRDDAWLLKVAGRPMDLRGWISVAVQDATRDCAAVRRVDASSSQAAVPVEALRQFSPPDSVSARVLRIDLLSTAGAIGDDGRAAPSQAQPAVWLALQAEFDTLEPVVVLVRQVGARADVMAQGVWSSTTLPWNSAWRIRRFLAERVPQAPLKLLACVDPLPVFAQPPRPIASYQGSDSPS